MDRLLMHTCCAPCSVYCVEALRGEGIEPVSFWYNPNIHPYQEYKARRDTLVSYAEQIGMELIVREDYGLREFVRAVAGDLDHRCGYCYTHITTTLLVSPYQDHDGIARAGRALAERYGLTFLYRDFRVGFRQGQAKARELGLYMQKYCGCVFSEEERYAKQIARDRAAFQQSGAGEAESFIKT